MAPKTNIEKLEEANVLDSSRMTAEHKRILNEEMSDEEVKALIKAKSRFGGDPWKPKADGGAF